MTSTAWTARAAAVAAPFLVGVALVGGLAGCANNDDFDEQWQAQQASDRAAAAGGSAAASPTATSAHPATKSPSRPAPRARQVFVFPVRSKAADYGRTHHDYPATDIFAACGTAVVAPAAGVVSEVSRQDHWSVQQDDGATRGGLSVSIVGADGVRYYGSHFGWLATSIVPGRRVRAGDLLGKVGHTGSARPTSCHLHFGLSPACGKGDWWNRRGVVLPYRFLKAWQAGRDISPAKAIAAWRAKHGCPKTPQADP